MARHKGLTNIVFVVALAFSITLNVMSVTVFDNSPALVVWDVQVLTPEIKAHEASIFRFSYRYNKRSQCYPPDGEGEVKFRLWSVDPATQAFAAFVELDLARMATADPQQHYKEAKAYLEGLTPGRYALQWHTTYKCKGASRLLIEDGPMMPFEAA